MIFDSPTGGHIRPFGSPKIPGNFRVTQDFGPTTNPYEPAVNWPGGEGIPKAYYRHFHKAIDLGDGRCGAPIYAAHSGRVTTAGKDVDGAIRVIIDHGEGWTSRSWHLHDEQVSVGQHVDSGHLIGHLGNTGQTGDPPQCHCHWATYLDGQPMDPWLRLRQNVTVHPRDMDGINIRLTAGSGQIFGPKYAETATGNIVRTDGKILTTVRAPQRWGGTVTGAEYPAGATYLKGDQWEKIELDGIMRFIASPLAVLSAK